MKINCNQDNPYGDIICRYFLKSLVKAGEVNKSDLLEIITDILIGTKEVRYGPMPTPEGIVKVRAVIRDAIEKHEKIPMLVPWGGIKASLSSQIDIAEVSGLQRIIEIDSAVKRFYTPGLYVNIGIEDTGAKWLFREDMIEEEIIKYSDSFSTLINILNTDSNIFPYQESKHLKSEKEYFKRSSEISEMLLDYIRMSDSYPNEAKSHQLFSELEAIGWKGSIPQVQRDYYRGRYKALYPGITDYKATTLLADYLAGAKARYDLDIKGIPKTPVEGYLKASFVPPIPGSPLGDSTLYYRTIPTSAGRTHIAPWRGKGYLKIEDKSSDITPKIISFNDEVITHLEEGEVIISGNKLSVNVRADYMVA